MIAIIDTLEWADLILGPLGALGIALFILMVIGIGLYRLAAWGGKNIPKWVESIIGEFKKMNDSHEEDRAIFKKTMEDMAEHHDNLAKEISEIRRDVQDIKAKV
jgi:hypothetical protein